MRQHHSKQSKFIKESIMPENHTENMINSVLNKNAVDFKNHLDTAMSEKIAAELRDKKTELANSMFKENNSKEMQSTIVGKKKREKAEDENDLAMKGSEVTEEEE